MEFFSFRSSAEESPSLDVEEDKVDEDLQLESSECSCLRIFSASFFLGMAPFP